MRWQTAYPLDVSFGIPQRTGLPLNTTDLGRMRSHRHVSLMIALTGDEEGPLYQPVFRGDRRGAEENLQRIVRAFGADHVYIELQRNHVPDEERITSGLIDLARAHNLPLVASNGVIYAAPSVWQTV
jgi:DNA polymerase III alpha subunit